MASDNTTRFSSRVEHYVRSRPGYPQALLAFFQSKLGLLPSHRIADIGSGTGLLSHVFLSNGNVVLGVEPNEPMRTAGEELLRPFPGFQSISGTAEATTLPAGSIDFVVAGQAFHWFDPVTAAAEFRRILVPGGYAAPVWNERRSIQDGFNAAYDKFIEDFTTDRSVAAIRGGSAGAEPAVEIFFGTRGFERADFANHQDLDRDGLAARVYSSSYMPLPNDPRATAMEGALESLFDTFAVDGLVRIEYETRLYYGRL